MAVTSPAIAVIIPGRVEKKDFCSAHGSLNLETLISSSQTRYMMLSKIFK
jgi:hypothetical protein